jgi:hypothetical protein
MRRNMEIGIDSFAAVLPDPKTGKASVRRGSHGRSS